MRSRAPKVLLYGKDARTDALAEAILRSPQQPELVIAAPLRIPGLVSKATTFVQASMTDLEAMVGVAKEAEPELVVVGPEDPLAAGLVDALEGMGIPCFGPSRELARVETSKSWARDLVGRRGVGGNPAHRTFRSEEGLEEYLTEVGEAVVKPDGLTGGKGVRIMGEQLADAAEALGYAKALLETDGAVVIEERLEGEEFSLMTITDGVTAAHCPVVQDHKRAFGGDTGPNTGGMGSYSYPDHSMPWLLATDLDEARTINEAAIDALAAETGRPFRGVLYGGFMAVARGVRLIEYNARFGDPEAMNVLPLLETDFVAVAQAVAGGRLDRVNVSFKQLATVCKYVVPAAYPQASAAGHSEVAVDGSVASPRLRLYWAAAEVGEDSSVRLTGSRGLAFVGLADSIEEAEALAEKGACSVVGSVRHRRDIGTTALLSRRTEHMNAVRAAGATAP
jgi:phosphoribosylamine--glycine ligase